MPLYVGVSHSKLCRPAGLAVSKWRLHPNHVRETSILRWIFVGARFREIRVGLNTKAGFAQRFIFEEHAQRGQVR